MTISNLAFALLSTISDNLPFYFYNVFECEYLGNGNIFYCLCCYANAIAHVAHCKCGYYQYDIFGEAFSFMFYNFMFFSMKSLKLIKTFMGRCIIMSFCIHLKSTKDIFLMYPMLPFTIFSLKYKFSIIMIFILL